MGGFMHVIVELKADDSRIDQGTTASLHPRDSCILQATYLGALALRCIER
jgi:hypothetical protein